MTERPKSLEQALEEAVSRALRDNLAPLQRTADELHQACADLVAACASTRPSNALPSMLRAQTAATALAAGLSVLSNFVAVALNPRSQHHHEEHDDHENASSGRSTAVVVEDEAPAAVSSETIEHTPEQEEKSPGISAEAETSVEAPNDAPRVEVAPHEAARDEAAVAAEGVPEIDVPEPPAPVEVAPQAVPENATAAEVPAFDVANLPSDLQDLHRRANRVAKVTMQDIQLLRPADVRLARENKDVCSRLRSDLDKARKEYDRRFRAIQDHPVDYFHHWMVEILAGGDENALGAYPYPSPVLRH